MTKHATTGVAEHSFPLAQHPDQPRGPNGEAIGDKPLEHDSRVMVEPFGAIDRLRL